MNINKEKLTKFIKDTIEEKSNMNNNSIVLFDYPQISQEERNKMYLLAYSFYQNNAFEQALSLFRLLCTLEPLNVKFWLGFAACQKMLKQYTQAIKAYGVLRLINPDCAKSSIQACHCYLQLGQKAKALECINDAKELAEMYQTKNTELSAQIVKLQQICQ